MTHASLEHAQLADTLLELARLNVTMGFPEKMPVEKRLELALQVLATSR